MAGSVVSLVCTVRDEADSIAALLDSMLAQSRRPDEIVVNDCMSRDETPAIVERYIAAGHPIVLVRGGFNIPSGRNNAIGHARGELIASDRSEEEICREIGADGLIYQDLDDLKASVRALNPSLQFFETSCFDGHYITGDITVEYLNGVENQRSEAKPGKNDQDDGDDGQLDLNLASDAEH